LTLAAEEFVKELQHITGNKVSHKNKSSALVRLRFSGKVCRVDLHIFQEEESEPRFKVVMLRGIIVFDQ
jgi:D-arabinose 1-dehydrogenase-like Zn-dependent alcohol dehydrogenase